MSDLPPQWPRAAANALWQPLRRAITTSDWPSVTTDYRTYADIPNHHTSGHATAAGFPKQLPKHEAIETGGRIIARIDHDKWPGLTTLGVYLWQDTYELAEVLIPRVARRELLTAMHHSTARQPFILDKNRHGAPKLRRHNDPRALITLGAARALEFIATQAMVEIITPELDAAFLGEDAINSHVVFAIAQRAGIGVES